jgi:hypothetical protein
LIHQKQQEVIVTNPLKFACFALFAAAPAIAQPPGVPPGPPAVEIEGIVDTNVVNTVDTNVVNTVDTNVVNAVDANVVNTVDTNVLNTVDTNVVNSIDADALAGLEFSSPLPLGASLIIVGTDDEQLRGVSASIASEAAGEICSISLSVFQSDGDREELGFSVMSNGQAQTVSRNYEIPIALTGNMQWEVGGNATASCWVSLTMTFETPSEPEAARLLGGAEPMRIEVR